MISLANQVSRVMQILNEKKEQAREKTAADSARETLATDLCNRDANELFANLRKATREEFSRSRGRYLRLSPSHVYNIFNGSDKRYSALIDPDSNKLPVEQFTDAVIRTVAGIIGQKFECVSPAERAAWTQVVADDFQFGTKRLTIQKRIVPDDNNVSRLLSERYGDTKGWRKLAEQMEQETSAETEAVESR